MLNFSCALVVFGALYSFFTKGRQRFFAEMITVTGMILQCVLSGQDMLALLFAFGFSLLFIIAFSLTQEKDCWGDWRALIAVIFVFVATIFFHDTSSCCARKMHNAFMILLRDHREVLLFLMAMFYAIFLLCLQESEKTSLNTLKNKEGQKIWK
ncbi:MAG: hypothetical protein OXC30_01725 [Alphaproteobacteria bacterium]|nr:hypothetical protein [Alphaproteobacteria bacterium]